ncbi:OLC1v1028987C1 [Oldenlandia corymbosa var. corymbosa]|uniref:OLC1v1028987C1 n=1 Tax=Oldenlandia corymbosa var. corymbosa TaxID=529605 RepID=A0AAV1CG52_OLDCO|nr:OLC1v1028987C1 [Oldenlandia corymbosa var. corymbosa]
MALKTMNQALIRSQLPLLHMVRHNANVAFAPSFASSLVTKLIRVPLHRVKETMDLEENDQFSALNDPDFSLETVVLPLKDFSFPKKANLVIEWKLEKLIKENEKNQAAYTRLLLLCGKLKNFETALGVFSSMEAQGIKPTSSVFNALISACLSSGNFMRALSLYELMGFSDEYNCDSDTYNAFMLAFANLGNKKAMWAWNSARAAAGFPPCLQTYEALILGSVKSKDFVDAERLFVELASTGFVPSLSILQNMLLVYTEHRNFCKIREYTMLLLDSSAKIDRYTAEKVLGLYYELRRVQDMEELLDAFTKSKQDLGILSLMHSMIIRLYVSTDRLDDVDYSVGRMLKQGISFRCPDDVDKIICLYFQHAAYDRLDLFLEIIRGSFKLRRSSYDILTAGYRRAGLQDKLDLVIEDMKKRGFVVS